MKIIALFILVLFIPQMSMSQTKEEIQATLDQYLQDAPTELQTLPTEDAEKLQAAIAAINLRCNATIIDQDIRSYYEISCQSDVYGSLQFDYVNESGTGFLEKYNYVKDGAIMLDISKVVVVASFITSDAVLLFRVIPLNPISGLDHA